MSNHTGDDSNKKENEQPRRLTESVEDRRRSRNQVQVKNEREKQCHLESSSFSTRDRHPKTETHEQIETDDRNEKRHFVVNRVSLPECIISASCYESLTLAGKMTN
jgi:hypothetical protein